MFKCIFQKEIGYALLQISLKIVPKGPVETN